MHFPSKLSFTYIPKEFLWKRLPQAFPRASFHIGKAWERNMERLIPKPFPHRRERQGLERLPSLFHMETKRGNGE
jgi:hypothetical protein